MSESVSGFKLPDEAGVVQLDPEHEVVANDYEADESLEVDTLNDEVATLNDEVATLDDEVETLNDEVVDLSEEEMLNEFERAYAEETAPSGSGSRPSA